MKKFHLSQFAVSRTLLAGLTMSPLAYAADFTWNTAGPSNNWDLSELNWGATPWVNDVGNNAIFGGTAETVTLTAPITAGQIKFNTAGYTLAGDATNTLAVGTIDTTATGGGTTTISAVISGTGPLTLKATGNLSSSGGGDGGLGIRLANVANTFTGDVTITSGLVSYANNASFGNAANKIILNGGGLLDNNVNVALSRDIQVLAGGGTFRTYGGANVTWSGAITGSGNINRTDGGTLTLSGDMSGYSGTYNNQRGNTNLTGTAATIGGNWNISSGSTVAITSSTVNQSISGVISGTGQFNKLGNGTLTLTGANTFSGETWIQGNTTSTLILANASGPALQGNVRIGVPGGGGSGGTLQLGANNQLTANSTIIFGHAFSSQHAYFKLNGFSTSIGGLTNGTDLGGEVINGAAGNSTLTLAGSGTYTFGPIDSGVHGTISNGGAGTLGIVKTGSGTQTFTGGNSYTGGTAINQGTLRASHATALGSGNVTIGGGNLTTTLGNLNLGTGSLSLNSGSLTLNGATAGTVTLGANQDFTMAGGQWTIDLVAGLDQILGSGAGADFLISGGTLDLGGGLINYGATYQLLSGFTTGSVSGLTISNYDSTNFIASLGNNGLLSFTAVPEPSIALLGGLGALGLLRRRRNGN